MKKTITINLAGVVFHIEEDAYEALQAYISSVRAYFKTVEGGEEILGDIESRIAEIFSEQISESRQAITNEEVQSVIRQMGTVEDMIGEGDGEEGKQNEEQVPPRPEEADANIPKRLYRDKTNAILGGVLAGIAAYFESNPLWIRLLFIGLFFGMFFLPQVGGSLFIVYMVLWIVMPSRENLDQGKARYKKFFRSRKDQVVAGVAGGMGRYFNVDPIVFRIIFILTLFAGGTGLIAYIILWAITPEAKSVTDEIQMEGNPVTLNSIEDQIRKNVKLDNKQTENLAIKILSFPIKILSVVVEALGPFVKFLFDAARVFLAIILLIIGCSLLFALIVTASVSMGLLDANTYHIQTGDFPLYLITQEITPWMISFGVLTALIPVLSVILVSVSLMVKRNLLRPIVFLVFVAIFFLGVLGSAYHIVPLANKFSSEGSFTQQQTYELKHKVIHLNRNSDGDGNSDLFPVEIQLHGWKENYFKLDKRFEAQGKNWKDAQNNARMGIYEVTLQDSTLIFDANMKLEPNGTYRAQRLEMDLYVPYDQVFSMGQEMEEILRETLYPYGYDADQLEGNLWVYTSQGLSCISCQPKAAKEKKDDEDWDQDSEVPDAQPSDSTQNL